MNYSPLGVFDNRERNTRLLYIRVKIYTRTDDGRVHTVEPRAYSDCTALVYTHAHS